MYIVLNHRYSQSGKRVNSIHALGQNTITLPMYDVLLHQNKNAALRARIRSSCVTATVHFLRIRGCILFSNVLLVILCGVAMTMEDRCVLLHFHLLIFCCLHMFVH